MGASLSRWCAGHAPETRGPCKNVLGRNFMSQALFWPMALFRRRKLPSMRNLCSAYTLGAKGESIIEAGAPEDFARSFY